MIPNESTYKNVLICVIYYSATEMPLEAVMCAAAAESKCVKSMQTIVQVYNMNFFLQSPLHRRWRLH